MTASFTMTGFTVAQERDGVSIDRSGDRVRLPREVASRAAFENAVAVLGTALGPQHVKILKRFADRIVLVLDGDEAGQDVLHAVTTDESQHREQRAGHESCDESRLKLASGQREDGHEDHGGQA